MQISTQVGTGNYRRSLGKEAWSASSMPHKRPYKEASPIHAAPAEIKELSGKQFDPGLCGIFLDLVPRLQREPGDFEYFLVADARNAKFIKPVLRSRLRSRATILPSACLICG